MNFQDIFSSLNIIVMVIVLLSGLFAKHYLVKWKLDAAWKTLIVSAVFVGIYAAAVIAAGKFQRVDIASYVLSFLATVVLYDYFLKKFMDAIGGKIQDLTGGK